MADGELDWTLNTSDLWASADSDQGGGSDSSFSLASYGVSDKNAFGDLAAWISNRHAVDDADA